MDLRNWYSSCRSRLAPLKLDPLSLWIVWGEPLLDINHFRPPMKVGVVRSDMTSRCTDLVEKQMKMHRYALT